MKQIQYSNTPSRRHASSFSRIFDNFFDGCITVEYAAQAVFAQGHHAQLDGFLAQNHGRGALVNQSPDGVINDQQLKNALSSAISRVVAIGATAAVIEEFFAQVMRREVEHGQLGLRRLKDRKSTRLNSSHVEIS